MTKSKFKNTHTEMRLALFGKGAAGKLLDKAADEGKTVHPALLFFGPTLSVTAGVFAAKSLADIKIETFTRAIIGEASSDAHIALAIGSLVLASGICAGIFDGLYRIYSQIDELGKFKSKNKFPELIVKFLSIFYAPVFGLFSALLHGGLSMLNCFEILGSLCRLCNTTPSEAWEHAKYNFREIWMNLAGAGGLYSVFNFMDFVASLVNLAVGPSVPSQLERDDHTCGDYSIGNV